MKMHFRNIRRDGSGPQFSVPCGAEVDWTRDATSVTEDVTCERCRPVADRAKLKIMMKHMKTKLEGFAGVLGDGTLVDRREHPEAIPMQQNDMLRIPEPQPLPFSK